MRNLPTEEKRKIQAQVDLFNLERQKFDREVAKWDDTGNDIVVLAKHMCMIMMEMTDFTRYLLLTNEFQWISIAKFCNFKWSRTA